MTGISARAAAVLSVMVLFSGAAMPWSTEFIPGDNMDGYVSYRDDNGAYAVFTNDGNLLAGNISGGAQHRRPFYIFDISGLPARKVSKAVLSLTHTGTYESSPGDGDILIEFLDDLDNPGSIDADDFDEDPATLESGGSVVFIPSGASVANFERVELDISGQVAELAGKGRQFITIRLVNTEETQVCGRYFATRKWAGYVPVLSVTCGSDFEMSAVSDVSFGGIRNYRPDTTEYDYINTNRTTVSIGDEGDKSCVRAFLKMELPEIPLDEVLESAELSFMMQSPYGNPWLPAELVCCVSEDPTLTMEDFDNMTGAAVIPEVIPTDTPKDTSLTVSGDVFTEYVAKCYRLGLDFVSLRFQMEGGAWSDEDTNADLFIIGTPAHPNELYRPVLHVSTLPAPPPLCSMMLIR